MSESPDKDASKVLTLHMKPTHSDAFKPQELIQVRGHASLTMNARRAITLLWHNAHCQGIEKDKDYTIEIDQLVSDKHKGQTPVEEAIELLMSTILTVRDIDGKTTRVQFLGGNDMDHPDRRAGVLTYSFDKRLTKIVQQSAIWGQLSLPVIRGFTSKYAVSLYENISQKVNLSHIDSIDCSVEEFRDMVGVPDDPETKKKRYSAYGDLNRHVIKPAVSEINLMAHFHLTILPIKHGKKIERVKIGWTRKDVDALREASKELNSSKVGRRARASETVQLVLDFVPTSERMLRQARVKKASPKTS